MEGTYFEWWYGVRTAEYTGGVDLRMPYLVSQFRSDQIVPGSFRRPEYVRSTAFGGVERQIRTDEEAEEPRGHGLWRSCDPIGSGRLVSCDDMHKVPILAVA